MSDQNLLEKAERFQVDIDFGLGFEQMIAECGCSCDSPHITAENYPVIGTGVVQQEIFLVDFGRAIDSSDAVRVLAAMGLEPARIEHAFAFGKNHSKTQRDRSVVFLGSPGVKLCECPPYIDYWGNRRLLKLGHWYLQWAKGCYFAAIKWEKRQEIFPIMVDYNRTLDQMVAACGCSYNNPNITAANFQITGTGADIVKEKIFLVNFRQAIDTSDAEATLALMGLQPARIEHAFAFGERYPDVQHLCPVVFLGSTWEGRSPCLCRFDNKRALDLGAHKNGWTRFCRFAAIQKNPESTT